MADINTIIDPETIARLNAAVNAQSDLASRAITDPETIARLNAAANALSDNPPKAITDPETVKRLEVADSTKHQSGMEILAGMGNAALGGVNAGIAHVPGLPVDLSNLVGNGLFGRFPAWVADKAGNTDLGDYIRRNGYHDIYPGSGQYFSDLLSKIGIGYEPKNNPEKQLKDIVAGGVTAGLTGALTGGLGSLIAGSAPESAALLSAARNQGLGGYYGESGAKLAEEGNETAGRPIPAPAAALLGALVGSHGISGAMNRTLFYEKPQIMKDADASGVPLYFPSEVGGSGLFSSAVEGLKNRLGAKNYSKGLAEDTQNKLSQSIQKDLNNDPNNPYNGTLQQQGLEYQQSAQKTIDALKDQTSQAYKDLESVVPGNSPVSTTNSSQIVTDMNSRAGGNAFIQRLVANPTFSRFADLPNNPILTWDQMNLLRQEAGAAMKNQNLSGAERGQAAQLYSGVMSDMRNGATLAHPTGLEKFELANRIARENGEVQDGILQNVIGAPSPETIPGYIVGQSKLGGTRLEGLMQGLTDAEKGGLGRSLLLNAARNPEGDFDPNLLAKFFNRASPEAASALTTNPSVAASMGRFSRLYDATTDSRNAITAAPQADASPWMFGLGTGGLSLGGAHLLEHAVSPDLLAAGAAGVMAGSTLAVPASAAAARTVLGTGFGARMTSPITGGMLTPTQVKQGVVSGPAAQFPDTYSPQPARPAPAKPPTTPAELGSMDRASSSAYIADKVPPQVAKEMNAGNDDQYRASLFNLMMDPQYRNTIFGSGQSD